VVRDGEELGGSKDGGVHQILFDYEYLVWCAEYDVSRRRADRGEGTGEVREGGGSGGEEDATEDRGDRRAVAQKK
jgi:hypothetical protein